MSDSKTTMQREGNEIQADVPGNLRGKERVQSGAKFMNYSVALEGKYMLHLKGKRCTSKEGMLHLKGRSVALQRKKRCTSRENDFPQEQ